MPEEARKRGPEWVCQEGHPRRGPKRWEIEQAQQRIAIESCEAPLEITYNAVLNPATVFVDGVGVSIAMLRTLAYAANQISATR